MKQAYLYLLIGTILVFFSLGINELNLIIHVIGYGFIIYGTRLINETRHSSSLKAAEQLSIGLILFELLKLGIVRVLANSSLLIILLMLLIVAAQLSIFYFIIKSEGDTSESLEVQTYQQADLLLSIGTLVLYFASFFSTFAITLFATIDLCLLIFLVYVFYKLYKVYHY